MQWQPKLHALSISVAPRQPSAASMMVLSLPNLWSRSTMEVTISLSFCIASSSLKKHYTTFQMTYSSLSSIPIITCSLRLSKSSSQWCKWVKPEKTSSKQSSFFSKNKTKVRSRDQQKTRSSQLSPKYSSTAQMHFSLPHRLSTTQIFYRACEKVSQINSKLVILCVPKPQAWHSTRLIMTQKTSFTKSCSRWWRQLRLSSKPNKPHMLMSRQPLSLSRTITQK